MIGVHDARMPFTHQAARDDSPPHAGHTGYVAGRYRDGAYSDLWTDVRRCAFRTFTAYAPACSCGWRGSAQPVTDIAYIACRRAWARDHAPREDDDLSTTVHGGVACTQLSSGQDTVG